MSAETAKSLRSNAPYDPITANDFGVRKFSGGVLATETTHKANVLPTGWAGREVGLIVLGGASTDLCYVAFSTNAAAEVAPGTATEAGASDKIAVPLPVSASVETRMRLPDTDGKPLYFVRESTATGVYVIMRLLG